MLVIISDVHLGDGTCGRSIPASAFYLFADRLQELAYNASWRSDGTYRPVEDVDILLLGDILDPLHSTRWLDTQPDEPDYVRPWTDTQSPLYARKLQQITQAILTNNAAITSVLQHAAQGETIYLPPSDSEGHPVPKSKERLPVKARIYYMCGNHDWYYHILGPAYDAIRQKVIQALGLINSPEPFPYEVSECESFKDLFARYQVYARHGDCYDAFNYDKDKGRDAVALGDLLAVEMLNRFPLEAQRRLGDELPPTLAENLHELTNVRPALAAPIWISSQISEHTSDRALQDKLKHIWDEMGEEFLNLDVVRQADKWLALDAVDALKVLLKITKRASFKTINDVITWVKQKMWGGEGISFARHAFKEPAFLDHSAR